MCGFCGEVRTDGNTPSLESVARMGRVLEPRGPDGCGVYQHGGVALAHRRLKIIDLSEQSAQPMVDNELGLALAYNGCIYNYRSLREELLRQGYRFHSSGDTEVILKAWHAWGPESLNRLQGMFAFALYERESGRVVLARDRIGIKPLYTARVSGAIRFSSTLPSLLAAGGIDTGLDPVSLHHYLSFHSVVPAPRTILRGIAKLAPGTLRVIEADGRTHDHTWWRLNYGTPHSRADLSFDDWRDLVLEALRESVRRRLEADVPVGVLLSGGLDSSLVVGLLAELGHDDINTFSVGFESAGGEQGDEFRYSDLVAERFATRHHQIRVGSDTLLPAMAGCVESMSEPMVSHDVIGFYLLSSEVARRVKVVQSGQGADEVFAGYHWYPPLLDSANGVADYARGFFDTDHAGFSETVVDQLVDEDHSLGYVTEWFSQSSARRAVDKALDLDTRVMLVEDPVKRVDNMTMAFGLEARVPFLDHQLVELAAQIPAEHKLAGGGKGVLKEAARRVIPAAVIDRPKGYFPVPALKYIRGEYLDFVREVHARPEAGRRGIFRESYVKRLLDRPDDHITPLNGSRLWQVTLLEYWLQTHGITL